MLLRQLDDWGYIKTGLVKNPGEFAGKLVLLTDDVVTTGSTLEACANELLKIQGTRVSIATLAFADY